MNSTIEPQHPSSQTDSHFSQMNNHNHSSSDIASAQYDVAAQYARQQLQDSEKRSNSPYALHHTLLPPPITQPPPLQAPSQPATTTRSRKRKSPSSNLEGPPPTFDYAASAEYQQYQQAQQSAEQPQPAATSQSQAPVQLGPGGRPLSTSKRAEQNRKAQRAFRERREQHVKALESRSQLLDAALETAEQANRRWEEARQLIEGLRVENATLRAALATYQAQAGVVGANPFSTETDPHLHSHPTTTHGLETQTEETSAPGATEEPVAPAEDQNQESNKQEEENTS